MKELSVGLYIKFRLGGIEYFGYIKKILDNGNLEIMFGDHFQLISEIKEKDIIY